MNAPIKLPPDPTKQEEKMLKLLNEVAGQVMTITPAMAEEWLARQGKQRPFSHKTVADYARAMVEGRWRLNGEAIQISRDDRPLNGQHRFRACIAAGVSFQSVVVTGLDPDVFDTIDTGRKRRASDVLAVEGYTNTAALAGAVRWLTAYRNGVWSISNIRLAPDEIRLFLAAEPTLEDSVRVASLAKKILAPSPGTALHYMFCEKDRDAANTFFRDLADGSGLSPTDPVWVVRERLIKDKLEKSKLDVEELFHMTLKAWNRRRSNQTATIAKGSIRDGSKKTYPKVA